MKTIAFLAERQIEFLVFVALLIEEFVNRIKRRIGAPFVKARSASP
jgi:hypothetical protein